MVTVEELYKAFGILHEAKDKAGEHVAEYRLFMEAIKGNSGEKRLASQFLTRFFKHFPALARETINALFDLCEDPDINIRKQAIKDLPSVCRVCPEHTIQIAEALSQLLACEDTTELSLVQSALVTLFSINARGVLEGIFQQILSDHEEEDSIREKSLKFLVQKLKTLPEDTIDKDGEDYIVNHCKKVLEDVTKDEYMAVMDILRSLKTMSTVQGRQHLVEIVTQQAELDQPFQATDPDCVDRLIQCIKTAAPLFSKNVHSKAFTGYLCDHALPALSDLASPDEDLNVQLEILKLLAEISEHAGDLENVESRVEKVYTRLLEYMPLPPEDDDEMSATEEPKLKFSFVECLMYTFHQLARRCPGFLADEANSERLKDFKLRLQYFARGVQVYIKQLRATLQGKSGDALRTDENKIKVVALKITSNINTLIKDLFHSPPAYKASITLSWKPITSKIGASTNSSQQQAIGEKRITPITYSSNGSAPKKANKEDRVLYSPPSGKFSQKAGNFVRGGGRGNFRGRWGFRGRRGQNFRQF